MTAKPLDAKFHLNILTPRKPENIFLKILQGQFWRANQFILSDFRWEGDGDKSQWFTQDLIVYALDKL